MDGNKEKSQINEENFSTSPGRLNLEGEREKSLERTPTSWVARSFCDGRRQPSRGGISRAS